MLKLSLPALFTLLLVSFLFSASFAAAKKPSLKIKVDSSKVAVKKFDAKAIDKLKADKDFNYNGRSTGEPTIWEQLWNWFWGTLARWFMKVPFGGTILQYLFIFLAICLLAYIIFKSLGIDPIRMLRGNPDKVGLAYSESLENIHEINFDAEIEKAIAQHNYRLAVRLLYLKCLKQLSDHNLIQWQIDKTNSAYLVELADPDQKQTFGVLTRQFEYVWYGNFMIDKQAFTNIDQLFQNFKKQLK